MRAKTASAGNHKTPQVNCSQLQPSLSPASACRLMLSPVPPPPQAAFFPDFDPRANLCSPSQPGTATRSSREARGSPPQRGACPRSSHLCSHRGLGSPGDAARPGADLGDLQTALERKRCMQRGRAGNLPAAGGGELPGGGGGSLCMANTTPEFTGRRQGKRSPPAPLALRNSRCNASFRLLLLFDGKELMAQSQL